MNSLFRKVICKAFFQLIEQSSSKKETSLKSQYKMIIDLHMILLNRLHKKPLNELTKLWKSQK